MEVETVVDNIAELNRLLLATQTLSNSGGATSLRTVVEQCQSTVIEGRMPDHTATIRFANSIGLVSEDSSGIRITEAGEAFLDLNPDKSYDLTEGQKRLLIRSCFLQGALRVQTRRLLKSFARSERAGTYLWSAIDSPPLEGDDWLVEHLRQLGILVRSDEVVSVDHAYLETVTAFLDESSGWSEREAEEYYAEKRAIGTLAEDLIVKYEAQRLLAAGCPVEARCVRRISLVRASAGYDIESFDSTTKYVNPDRFIEVKGSRGDNLRLMWTDNEMKVAKKLGQRYWIYYLGGIDLDAGRARNEPLLFQDPHISLLKDSRIKATPQGLIIEGPVRGAVRRG